MNISTVSAIFKVCVLPTALLFGIGTPAGFVAKHYQEEQRIKHNLANNMIMSASSFQNVEELKQKFYNMTKNKIWKFKIPNEEALNSIIYIYENSKIIDGISKKIRHPSDYIQSGVRGDVNKFRSYFMLGNSTLNSLLDFAQEYIRTYGFIVKCDYTFLSSIIDKCEFARSYKDEILNLCDRDIEMVIQSYKKMLQGLKKLKLINNIDKGVEIGFDLKL